MPAKKQVVFNEFNVLMGTGAYLPLVSGLLRAYAELSGTIKENYEFREFLFHRDEPEKILAQYDDPAVAAFSVSMWNEQLALEVARRVRAKFPSCLIVFGGPQVPQHPREYFEAHPFIDVAVRAEGEEAFAEILERFLGSRDFSGIANVAFRDPATGSCVRNEEERPQSKDLDVYPSPYLEGLFDPLIAKFPHFDFQAIIETNRGCPFLCTFCFWGQGGLSRKYRFHGMERLRHEFEWIADKKIKYVFNADSNFGMHKRDYEIAQMLCDTKKATGFPDKFRTCFGKNTDDKIYEIAMLLHANGLEKGITLARQSNDEETLKAIKRENIKLSTYQNLQVRFNEGSVPVYSELILGLPGETYKTWTDGIDEMFRSGLKNQLFTYLCQVFPNTDLADPDYQKRYGIKTQKIKLTEIHGKVRGNSNIPSEYEDIIVSTAVLPTSEWRKAAVFSWMTMTMHSLKLGFYIMIYLQQRHGIRFSDFLEYLALGRMPEGLGGMLREESRRFYEQTERLLNGAGRGHELPEYGDIYWDEEEASFLRISRDLDRFYDEMLLVCEALFKERGIEFDAEELAEAVLYQRMRIPEAVLPKKMEHSFRFNFPEYFETCFREDAVLLAQEAQRLVLKPTDFKGNLPRYARETILWGRKSGTMLVPAESPSFTSRTKVPG